MTHQPRSSRRAPAASPADRRVMVAGQLDAIRHSDRTFTLVLQSGEVLRGIAPESIKPDELAQLFGQPALVTGLVKFERSGKVLHSEAERIEPVQEDIAVWSTMPRPLADTIPPDMLRSRPRPESGVAAIFGQWPGDESEEEIRAALEDLS